MPSHRGAFRHSRRMHVAREFAFGVSAALLLSLLGGQAFAQVSNSGTAGGTGTSNQAGGIETVTVTAQYVQQNIQTAPLAITAVTGQDLEARGINDLSQLGTSVPGLTLTKAPAAFGNGVQTYIRGVGQYDTAFAAEPGVGMYIDDIYYGTLSGSILDLIDVNRIEVLRGPQGVLGGKNNIGGAIRIISQKPTGDNSGYLEATYGSYNEINVRGVADVSIIPDRLFARLSVTSRNQDGYLTVLDYACMWGPGTNPSGPGSAGNLPVRTQHQNCHNGTQGGTDVQGARLALRAVFTPQIEDNFSIDVERDNSEVAPDVLYAADPNGCPDPTCAGVDAYVNTGHGVRAVPRTDLVGINSLGIPLAQSGIPAWNNAPKVCIGPGGTPPCWGPGNLGRFGIPWDQRFIPNGSGIYKFTYGDYYGAVGQHYTDGNMLHMWGMTNVFDWDILDNVHFKNITGYRTYNGAYSNDSDVSPMFFELTTTYPINTEWQEEGRFTGTLFDNKLEWTAGGFYYHRINRSHGPVTLDADYDEGATFLVFEQNDTYRTTNKSVYLHGIYHVLDDLEVFGGVRYTSEQKIFYFDHSEQVPGYPLSGFFRSTVDPALDCNIFAGHFCDHSIHPPLLPHESRTARPDWRAGLDYHFTDDIMGYFQFSTGYRTGGTNSRPFAPDQLTSYGPENIKSYEIGAKTEWFDHRLRFNAALFDADYSKVIVPLAETDVSLGFPLPFVHYVNLGSSTNKGFELEATAAPIDNLIINASYSYIQVDTNPVPGAVSCPTDGPAVCGAGITGTFLDGCSPQGFAAGLCDANPGNFPGIPHTSPGTVRKGTAPILFPKDQLHLDIQYTFQLCCWGSLTPRLDYNWQNTVYQSANQNKLLAIPSRGLLDARLTWEPPSGGWQLSAAVTNITGKRYFLDLFNLAAFGEGTVEGQPGPPREWMLTLRKNF